MSAFSRRAPRGAAGEQFSNSSPQPKQGEAKRVRPGGLREDP